MHTAVVRTPPLVSTTAEETLSHSPQFAATADRCNDINPAASRGIVKPTYCITMIRTLVVLHPMIRRDTES